MRRLLEARGDTAVFTFGRFNPPTTGHEKLINALDKQVVAGAKMYVYPSHSQNAKKDPLPHGRKVAYMKKMFPKYAKNITVSRARNVFEIAVELFNKGHKAIIMVVGSDRVAEFDKLLNTYNGVEAKHGYYGFDDIKVLSAGERDPDAEGVTGMSASKMRAAAAKNDFEQFKLGLPKGFKDGEKLFADVRKFMGLREENWTFEEILRDLYVRGEIFNINEEVISLDGDKGKIVRKGTNYVVMETNEELKKVWIFDLIEAKKITKTKQEKDVEDIKGTQPAKYYAKGAGGKDMSKSTKTARARFFAKGADKPDNDPDSYKPAPGDANKKTKPSQYTKKFKQMYGEKEKYDSDKFFGGKGTPEQRLQLLKLQNKALKAIGGSPKQKAIKKEIDALRKKMGMKVKTEKLGKDADAGDYIKDFRKSDAPQFKGKSDKKIRDMAIAAYLDAKDKKESYEIGKDYADHTKEIDPYSAPEETNEKSSNEKSTLRKDKKLPNLMLPKKGKAGVTKFMRRKNLQKLAADVQADIDEQTTHEITVGDYTTKFFYMCGSAQTTMKKHADKDGAEELTRMQDLFYKMEKDAMDTNGASEEQKKKAEILYDKIITKAEEMGIAKEVDSYMKMHLDSMIKGEPKLGFGRTDISESLWANIHKKRERIKRGSGEKMRKVGDKGAPTPAQMKRAKGEEVEVIDEKIAGLVTKSEKTGIPYGILKKSYDRGMAAWKTGHRPGTTPQQWAFARVNSMVTGGKADPDLQAKIKAGGYKKKKKAKKESIEDWYLDTETHMEYKERYGSEWSKQLNNTYETMLLKLSEDLYDHIIEQAEYQGKKVKLNDPIRTSENPNKKFKVYVKNEKGKVVVVRFGDPNMSINRDDPERRKNFRARHQCDTNPGPKWKARYWSCFQWRAGAKVDN